MDPDGTAPPEELTCLHAARMALTPSPIPVYRSRSRRRIGLPNRCERSSVTARSPFPEGTPPVGTGVSSAHVGSRATRLGCARGPLLAPGGMHLAELDANGTWIETAEFGPAWKPAAQTGWMPFRNGKWIWYDGLGYTWVSAEPWGFYRKETIT